MWSSLYSICLKLHASTVIISSNVKMPEMDCLQVHIRLFTSTYSHVRKWKKPKLPLVMLQFRHEWTMWNFYIMRCWVKIYFLMSWNTKLQTMLCQWRMLPRILASPECLDRERVATTEVGTKLVSCFYRGFQLTTNPNEMLEANGILLVQTDVHKKCAYQ